MKTQIRRGVFETNSSSTHSLQLVNQTLDEAKKEGVLIKNDGTEISRYSYKNLVNKDFTIEKFKEEIDNFNTTLEQQEDFDNIKDLSKAIKIHNW